ncbi:hypothetical protein RHS01_10972 [Rhizoctonia solani]|uniref:Uncharacterized protein n=1 Tax=Rhizoctonia solani TaxID=456999 RepID=A0A8H7I2D4_9AGAM|nr:hypothetical protein RHS01_10972 [Rhizoctonia solani]
MRSSLQASSHAGRSYPQHHMSTHSRATSQAQSPFDQGHVEPLLLPTTSVKYGEVSLEQVTQLLLGLLNQVKRLKQEIAKIKEAGIKTQTNVENISQTVDVVKDGLQSLQHQGPRTPEGPQPKTMEETPRPLPKAKPIGLASGSPSGQNQPRLSQALPSQPQEEPHPCKHHLPLRLHVSNP